jgi:hypothetical protein
VLVPNDGSTEKVEGVKVAFGSKREVSKDVSRERTNLKTGRLKSIPRL